MAFWKNLNYSYRELLGDKFFKKIDWLLILPVIFLCFIGLLQIYSLGLSTHNLFFFKKQLAFFILGVLLMVSLIFWDYRFLKNNSFFVVIIYLFSLLLLLSIFLLGKTVKGSTAWISFGNFIFQPVEFAKLAIVLVLAKYFSKRHIEMYRAQHIIISAFYVFLLVALTLLQPDLGSAMVLVFIWLGIIILAGIKARHLLIVFLIGMLILSVSWFSLLKEYQKQRILSFLNPQTDPLGYSYSLNQSLIAIGSGGILGKGLGQGTQSQLHFLPESRSDFIFAAFAEEWGFVGVSFLFILWLFFFHRLIRICLLVNNNFSRIFVVGVLLVFFSHVVINLGVNFSLLPITGIPLPFISYGGSNLIVSFISLGIIQSIGARI